MLPHLQKIPYDPFKSFVPVILLVTVPNILVVHPSVPAKSVQELVAYAKANPGKLTYASQGVGASGHIAAELFKLHAGIDIVHVPYKGAAPAAQDLAAGHVSMMFDVVSLALGPIQAGRVRPLGVATKQRVSVLPDVPTMTEQGAPVEVGAWFGMLAPAGTPAAATAWLTREAQQVFSKPDASGRFVNQGAAVPLLTGDAFANFIAAESARYGDVIRRAGITLQ
jgi:tripartite-type tricarboxylate transporter receptor subunit TctC